MHADRRSRFGHSTDQSRRAFSRPSSDTVRFVPRKGSMNGRRPEPTPPTQPRTVGRPAKKKRNPPPPRWRPKSTKCKMKCKERVICLDCEVCELHRRLGHGRCIDCKRETTYRAARNKSRGSPRRLLATHQALSETASRPLPRPASCGPTPDCITVPELCALTTPPLTELCELASQTPPLPLGP